MGLGVVPVGRCGAAPRSCASPFGKILDTESTCPEVPEPLKSEATAVFDKAPFHNLLEGVEVFRSDDHAIVNWKWQDTPIDQLGSTRPHQLRVDELQPEAATGVP